MQMQVQSVACRVTWSECSWSSPSYKSVSVLMNEITAREQQNHTAFLHIEVEKSHNKRFPTEPYVNVIIGQYLDLEIKQSRKLARLWKTKCQQNQNSCRCWKIVDVTPKDIQPTLGSSAKDDVRSSQTMVDGSNHNHAMVHIEMQKQLDLRRNPTHNNPVQGNVCPGATDTQLLQNEKMMVDSVRTWVQAL